MCNGAAVGLDVSVPRLVCDAILTVQEEMITLLSERVGPLIRRWVDP